MRHAPRRLAAALAALTLLLVAGGCGGSATSTAEPEGAPAGAEQGAAANVALVVPREAQKLIADGGVQVLDVRTPEEFAAGHVKGATLIDFYEPDFAERIAQLDRDAAYVVYCRSGNRSGQATALMAKQGFTDVSDVDGGVVAWQAAGLPLER